MYVCCCLNDFVNTRNLDITEWSDNVCRHTKNTFWPVSDICTQLNLPFKTSAMKNYCANCRTFNNKVAFTVISIKHLRSIFTFTHLQLENSFPLRCVNDIILHNKGKSSFWLFSHCIIILVLFLDLLGGLANVHFLPTNIVILFHKLSSCFINI